MSRLRQTFLWFLVWFYSFTPSLIVCWLVWLTSTTRSQEKKTFQKTVLVTGAPLTKTLHLVRTLGRAGHRVILADHDPTFVLTMTRFSKYLSKFIMISPKQNYQDALVQICQDESVDWFIPVSHIDKAVDDVKVNRNGAICSKFAN